MRWVCSPPASMKLKTYRIAASSVMNNDASAGSENERAAPSATNAQPAPMLDLELWSQICICHGNSFVGGLKLQRTRAELNRGGITLPHVSQIDVWLCESPWPRWQKIHSMLQYDTLLLWRDPLCADKMVGTSKTHHQRLRYYFPQRHMGKLHDCGVGWVSGCTACHDCFLRDREGLISLSQETQQAREVSSSTVGTQYRIGLVTVVCHVGPRAPQAAGCYGEFLSKRFWMTNTS